MARITVEDCLKQIPNRFELALAATYRARQLAQGHTPKIESRDKPTVVALREIAAGQVEVLKTDGLNLYAGFSGKLVEFRGHRGISGACRQKIAVEAIVIGDGGRQVVADIVGTLDVALQQLQLAGV